MARVPRRTGRLFTGRAWLAFCATATAALFAARLWSQLT
jgi:hypothetical protein